MQDATPLRTCEKGGRKIIMVPEFEFPKDVKPRFELYGRDGKGLKKDEQLLAQPQEVTTRQHSLMFITPHQTQDEDFIMKGYLHSQICGKEKIGPRTKFSFQILSHVYYIFNMLPLSAPP